MTGRRLRVMLAVVGGVILLGLVAVWWFYGPTALVKAARRGDLKRVKLLVSIGVSPNRLDRRGMGALGNACGAHRNREAVIV